MLYEFRLPDTVPTEAELIGWDAREGENVAENQPLCRVLAGDDEVSVPCPRAGTLLKQVARVGDKVRLRQLVAILRPEDSPLHAAPKSTPPEDRTILLPPNPLVGKPGADMEGAQPPPILALPAVRRLASELNIDLANVAGTGPHGRIMESDVRKAAEPGPVPEQTPAKAPTPAYDEPPAPPPPAQPETVGGPQEVPPAAKDDLPEIPVFKLPSGSEPPAEPRATTPASAPVPEKAPGADVLLSPGASALKEGAQAPIEPEDEYFCPLPDEPASEGSPSETTDAAVLLQPEAPFEAPPLAMTFPPAPSVPMPWAGIAPPAVAPEPAPAAPPPAAMPPPPAASAPAPTTQDLSSTEDDRMPFVGPRRRAAERIAHSWRTIPHAYANGEADATALRLLLRELQPEAAKRRVDLSELVFVIRALAKTLPEFPDFNAHLFDDGAGITRRRGCDIGLALPAGHSLLVPVIKDAQKRDFWTLAAEIDKLPGRVRERRIPEDELHGATFTVTPITSSGSIFSFPTINAPEASALGLTRAHERAVVIGGGIHARWRINLALAYDRRVSDPVQAAAFLGALARRIEAPRSLA
ncbi:MAG: 2-oxo acid dehydrogenase subunit E2 [Elusimicrobia bacterium]|nr:2-oxo acid dehydrogenase subunit E2 [Elusimicrobiota bacterium]